VYGVGVVIVSAQRNRSQCPNLLHLRPARRGIAEPRKLQRLQSCKTGITAEKEPGGDNTGVFRESILLEMLLFAAPISSHHNKTATVFRTK
jgi:hypothetical protein